MAKWFATGYEGKFKPVPGGYVFQPRRSIGDGRNHLVNEAQKTAIMNILGRSQRFNFLGLLAVGLGTGVMPAVVAIRQHNSLDPAHTLALSQVIADVTPLVLTLFPAILAIASFAYARRKLQPLLATLPTTEERITFSEQMETMARNLPGAFLGLSFGLGVAFIVVSMAIYNQVLFGAWFAFAVGTVIIAFVVWLIVLRKRKHGDAA